MTDKKTLQRMQHDGLVYGYEWAGVHGDALDKQVDAYLAQLAGAKCFPDILDLGGGTGARAESFARLGFNVTMVDIGAREEIIAARNAALGREAIRFIQADLTTLDFSQFESTQWALVNIRRSLHFLKIDGIEKIIRALPSLSNGQTHVALCFDCNNTNSVRKPMQTKEGQAAHYRHNAHDIIAMLKREGFDPPAPTRDMRNYPFFSKIPVKA